MWEKCLWSWTMVCLAVFFLIVQRSSATSMPLVILCTLCCTGAAFSQGVWYRPFGLFGDGPGFRTQSPGLILQSVPILAVPGGSVGLAAWPQSKLWCSPFIETSWNTSCHFWASWWWSISSEFALYWLCRWAHAYGTKSQGTDLRKALLVSVWSCNLLYRILKYTNLAQLRIWWMWTCLPVKERLMLHMVGGWSSLPL